MPTPLTPDGHSRYRVAQFQLAILRATVKIPGLSDSEYLAALSDLLTQALDKRRYGNVKRTRRGRHEGA